MRDLTDPLAVFVVAVLLALLGVESRQRVLLIAGKPIATLALIGVAWPPGAGAAALTAPGFAPWTLVVPGLLLCAIGDAALIAKKPAAFMVGVVTFLIAHLLYAAAFLLGGAVPLWSPAVGVLVFGAASGWLVRQMWGNLPPALRLPLLIYTAACTAMAAAALATVGGPWATGVSLVLAAGGALFFVSDSNLAWNDFVAPYPHGQTVTLTLYWAGQLCIALATRWASAG